MRRLSPRLLGLSCLLSLTAACFWSALFRDGQFTFRDAGHFYYPLYQRVQQEWDAGRLPLWEPEENAGMPLLGNPSAAVLYPGKIAFCRPIPYAWGVRIYTIGHVLLAVAAMFALVRSWGISRAGAGLSALSYGFGAPVLFQYCNIIFLVGAAWTPLGLRAADRWLRLGKRSGLAELAVVLAMQALGGDPQAAYLTALCAGGYALGLSRWTRNAARLAPVALATAAALIGLAWGLGAPTSALRAAVPAAWGGLGLFILVRARRPGATMPRRLIGLGSACGLALALSAAQLVPVAEFAGLSMRAAEEGPHDIYPFSLEPYRVVELAWPTFFGPMMLGENRSWIFALPPTDHHHVWIPSLYLGGLTLVLALGAMGFRNGPAWRGWMTGIVFLSLLAGFGEYAGPAYWARFTPPGTKAIGPHDPQPSRAVRLDGHMRDGDGSPYWLLANALPGFGQFRYPAKLLVLTTLALAALGGIGWDRVLAGDDRRARRIALVGAVASGLILAAVTASSGRIVAALESSLSTSSRSAFGPVRADLAFFEMQRALLHGGVVLGLSFALLQLARRQPRTAAMAALVLLTADLAVANARFIQTSPQAAFDAEPEALVQIRKAEDLRREEARAKGLPDDGPFRVHNLGAWEPAGWVNRGSPDRMDELLTWSRDTLQPKFAIPYGIEYTAVEGTAELYDYWWFFAPFDPKLDAQAAKALGMEPGERVVYHPRRGYDLWNSRYFIVPVHPGGWRKEHRSYLAFLTRSRPIYPPFLADRESASREVVEQWLEHQDWQILRNEAAYPRAWVVHKALFRPTIEGLRKEDRKRIMGEILYEENPFWHEPRDVIDPHEVAWIETDERGRWSSFASGGAPDRSETVGFDRYDPTRVEMTAILSRPGFVVLADVDYPGWRLTIDGKPSPILKANRLMRGAAVEAGTHKLVYKYEPASLKVGVSVSLAGLVTLAGLVVWSIRQRDARLSQPPGRLTGRRSWSRSTTRNARSATAWGPATASRSSG